LPFGALLVWVLAASAMAGTQTVAFSFSGNGSLLSSPPGFTGMILSGPLAGGSLNFYVNDWGWPVDDPSTPTVNERWEYILANFFTYDGTPGAEKWTLSFPKLGSSQPSVAWHCASGADALGGYLTLKITIYDTDADGIVDATELANQAVAVNFSSYVDFSMGSFQGYCGLGSGSGFLEDVDPTPNDGITLSGTLFLRDFMCGPLPADAPSWGRVKAMYEE
jgi:hypothetical protein